MRETLVRLIKLTTCHTYTAVLWSLLCSHQFSSQGKMYGSQIPPCRTTQHLYRNAYSPFRTSNHGFIYWKLSLKCKVLVNHQAIPQIKEELHDKVHFQMWQGCSEYTGALLWEGSYFVQLQIPPQHNCLALVESFHVYPCLLPKVHAHLLSEI